MRARSLLAPGAATLLALAASACGSSKSTPSTGGSTGTTRLTIYSSLPLQGAASGQNQAINDGARLALKEAGRRVGRFRLRLVPLDDSVASTGAADNAKTAKNARQAASDRSTIGYIGEYNSGATKVSLPILNRAGIAQVSPANTNPGITTNKPGSLPGEPDKFYPTGKRTYARVVPIDTIQGAAIATAVKQDGCKAIHVWNTKTPYSAGLATNLIAAARKLGITVQGNDGIDPQSPNYRGLAQRVTTDCFVFTGEIENNGVQAYKDVAAADPAARLYGGDGVVTNALADPRTGLPAGIAARFKGTIATLDPRYFPASGKRFFTDFDRTYHTSNPNPYAIYGFESMKLLLDSIKAAGSKGNDRAAVVDAMLHQKNRHSVLGTYSITPTGDTTLTDYGLYGIKNGKLVFLRVIHSHGAG